jgi:hypothetical protein
MSTVEQAPTKLALRAAMEAKDLAGAADAFAPNAVLRSPLTDKLTFNGREQIAAIMGVIIEAFADLHYTAEVRDAHTAFLAGHATIAGKRIEWADQLELAPDGEITEFFRPLPVSAVALRVIGSALCRRKSPLRAAAVSALARPLGLMATAGDGIGVRLVQPTL